MEWTMVTLLSLSGQGAHAWGYGTPRNGIPPESIGLFSADSTLLPAAVRKAARSVYRIVLPGGRLVDAAELFKVSTYKDIPRQFADAQDHSNSALARRTLIKLQLDRCLARHLAKCQMFNGMSAGTAFLTGDGGDLRTALHVVHDFVVASRTAFGEIDLPLVLFDELGQVIWDTATHRATMAAVSDHAIFTSVTSEPGGDTSQVDQVLIRLDQRIGQPIPIAAQAARTNDLVFLAGYPAATTDRARWRSREGTDAALRLTRGHVLGTGEIIDRLKRQGFETNDAQAADLTLNQIATTCASLHGFSGGPVLNVRGEVVGVNNKSTLIDGSGDPFGVSFASKGVIPSAR